ALPKFHFGTPFPGGSDLAIRAGRVSFASGSAKISFWHSLSGRLGFGNPSWAGEFRLRLCQNFILALRRMNPAKISFQFRA
ncbi:MAG: hypothetical protein DRI57_26195, partial [Deltaproteobacteria bacterium]